MARNTYLKEHLSFTQARVELLSEEAADGSGHKTLKLKGVCIEGGVRNANERVYPVSEIAQAVETINEQITTGHSVLGEVDHPDDLKINLDRVSHMIEKMWMDGPAGMGTLKILPTPMGELVKTMLTNGVKLGVSSRGSGNVNDANGHVSDFEIVTVDVVAQPSAPNAYPTAIYEGLLNTRGGQQLLEMYKDPASGNRAQRYVRSEVLRVIRELKLG
jgi:hypothetical protein